MALHTFHLLGTIVIKQFSIFADNIVSFFIPPYFSFSFSQKTPPRHERVDLTKRHKVNADRLFTIDFL